MRLTPVYNMISLRLALLIIPIFSISATSSLAWEMKKAPPLPPPKGKIIRVGNAITLENAVKRLKSGTTILIEPGEYHLKRTLVINKCRNVALRGATGAREDVVIRGKGMREKNHGGVSSVIAVFDAENVLIADLTLADAWHHNLHLAGNQGPVGTRIYNVHLKDSGQQLLKVNPGAKSTVYPDHGIVEFCLFGYTDHAKSWYTNGVDVLAGEGWVIRDNVFKSIKGPVGEMSGPAVLFFSNAKNNIIERNLFLDCDVGIACGIFYISRRPRDSERRFAHQKAIIRNNMIVRNRKGGGPGIVVGFSDGFKIYHNTIILNSTYPYTILYGGTRSSGEIAYNLTDGPFIAVDDRKAIDPWSPNFPKEDRAYKKAKLNSADRTTLEGNIHDAAAGWFIDARNGDLHLAGSANDAINKAKSSGIVIKDYDGQNRPRGKAFDIGADEY